MNLTSEQLEVVQSTSPKIIVVAGPGSGKTATTVSRIKHLIANGADSRAMIVLTFTNAAAGEISERLEGLWHENGDESMPPTRKPMGYVGTLHGFALRCLKRYGEEIGFGDRMALIGEEAVLSLIESKAKSLGCKTPIKNLLKLKATGQLEGWTHLDEMVVGSYYQDLNEAGLVDFDTILRSFLMLIQRGLLPPIYTHLFVDEVQDSASIDWDIYNALPIANKFFVGDEDQSIYAFRGGRPDLMRTQQVDDIFVLESNFRSRDEVCQAANRLIEHTKERYPKVTKSTRGPGGEVMLWSDAENSGQEVADVAEGLGKELENGTLADEIAILARTNAIAGEMRAHLKATGIQVSEKIKDTLPRDWRLAKALIELAANPANDTLAYFYLLESARASGMSDKDARAKVDALQREARSEMMPLSCMIGFPLTPEVADAGKMLAQNRMTQETRMRVATIIRKLPAGADLLELVLAMTQDEGAEEGATPGVTVTTIHQAKGREWDAVFIVGVEEEAMIYGGGRDPAVVDEARRLMYVAVTRARENVYLSYAKRRATSWGKIEPRHPCRFIKEMGL